MHLFTQKLLQWWKVHQRSLPWKTTKDPYKIWLSEIILQQTRVQQGLPYYQKFVQAYPTVQDLAAASSDEVMHMWEGLGYYSRARNMHTAAKYITKELNGVFPNTFKAIKALKGVGPYTAAAIASFAFDLPHAAVDGNMYRVLSRYFGISTPIDSTKGKKDFAVLAQQLLPPHYAADFNQAVMDFGSLQCVPKKVACGTCPLKNTCVAFSQNKVSKLPVKSKRLKKRSRFFNYLLVYLPKKEVPTILLRQRTDKDIWQNLHDFPLIETQELLDINSLQNYIVKKQLFDSQLVIKGVSKMYKQQLTHQTIYARFFTAQYPSSTITKQESLFSVPLNALHLYACPKLINNYLNDINTEQQMLLF